MPPFDRLSLQHLGSARIQEEVRQSLTQLDVQSPTRAQWDMILAPYPSAYVIAGAGSGKSTTLILRLLVLHKVLRIPLDEIHVFSFTRASTQEFQRKLADKLVRWEEVIEHKTMTRQRQTELQTLAKRTVSTFHSVIARLSRDALPGGNPDRQFFDLLGNASADEERQRSYNPFVNPNLSDEQVEVLNAAHASAYRDMPRYRELITGLLQDLERKQWQKRANDPNQDAQMEQWKWDQLLRQEKTYHGYVRDGYFAPSPFFPDQRSFPYVDPYRAFVADRLREWNIPFTPLIPFEISCPIPGGFPGQLYASFQIADQLFLHIERYRNPNSEQGNKRNLAFHERTRRRFIITYSGESDHHKFLSLDDFDTRGATPVLKPNGSLNLQRWLSLCGYAVTTPGVPHVRIQLPGDSRRTEIAELLYQEGVFIESLGLEVEQFKTGKERLDLTSQSIAEALPLFWQAFRQELFRRDMVRFHDVLVSLRNPETLHRLQEKLKHLRHLFIDEFQDISPEIVDWLSQTLRVHALDGTEVSVIGIGDDYQSIYGWRGSHPTFLLHFDQCFPVKPVGSLVLVDNFRSRQPIIDAAEAVLAPVKVKRPKHGVSSCGVMENGRLDPVRLVEAPLSWSSAWETFCGYVTMLLRDLETAGHLSQLIGNRQALSVFILARTNQTLESVRETGRLGSRLRQELGQGGVRPFQDVFVKAGTFHTSKGLEADVVLLLDDVLPPEEHPLRELVFSQIRFPGKAQVTYTQTMSDEARRLAYVALTRARLGVMWVPLSGDDAQLGANTNNQANASVASQGSFVLVKQYLQATGRMQ